MTCTRAHWSSGALTAMNCRTGKTHAVRNPLSTQSVVLVAAFISMTTGGTGAMQMDTSGTSERPQMERRGMPVKAPDSASGSREGLLLLRKKFPMRDLDLGLSAGLPATTAGASAEASADGRDPSAPGIDTAAVGVDTAALASAAGMSTSAAAGSASSSATPAAMSAVRQRVPCVKTWDTFRSAESQPF